MSESKEVAVATPAGVPATSYDYGDDSGAGFEGTQSKDLSVPFLAILQSNSPQVVDKDPVGAESGMLFNTVTKQMWDGEGPTADGVAFIPVHKEQVYVEWVPRDAGGGMVGMHDPNGDVVEKAIEDNDGKPFGKLHCPDSRSDAKSGAMNDLVQTFYVYGLFLDEDGISTVGFGVVSFTSTKIKPYRDWITAMYTLKGKPPMFANRAILRTVKQKNDSGTFFNFRIDPLGATWKGSLINPVENKELLNEARDFRDMVVSGMAKADFASQHAASGKGGDPAADGGDGEDAPF
jgi:hypothetical protein